MKHIQRRPARPRCIPPNVIVLGTSNDRSRTRLRRGTYRLSAGHLVMHIGVEDDGVVRLTIVALGTRWRQRSFLRNPPFLRSKQRTVPSVTCSSLLSSQANEEKRVEAAFVIAGFVGEYASALISGEKGNAKSILHSIWLVDATS